MSSADWVALTGSLGGSDLAKGVTHGLTPPSGGGSFVYAMNALTATPGMAGLYASPQAPNTNFNPLLKGGDIRGAVQKGVANGNTGYSAFLFMLAQGTTTADNAYMLGLSDGGASSHIELRKGSMLVGLPDEAPGGSNKILQQSTASFAPGTWVHLRLEVVVNISGDVVINCYENDLNANPVTAPVWTAIPGISQFIDDAVGINTGTLPYVAGRAGFGGQFNGATRRAYFDQIEFIKQT
jgi:hypothetical protein